MCIRDSVRREGEAGEACGGAEEAGTEAKRNRPGQGAGEALGTEEKGPKARRGLARPGGCPGGCPCESTAVHPPAGRDGPGGGGGVCEAGSGDRTGALRSTAPSTQREIDEPFERVSAQVWALRCRARPDRSTFPRCMRPRTLRRSPRRSRRASGQSGRRAGPKTPLRPRWWSRR